MRDRLVEGLKRAVSPSYRRWQAILDSSTLDPSTFGHGELEDLSARDFLICGHPRSGTALVTAQLFQPPAVVTVMEPWDGMRLPPAELVRSLRAEVDGGSLRRGRLDVQALQDDGDVRWVQDGAEEWPVSLAPDGQLGVKWPGFWRYLDLLPSTRFLVCLRHPAEVVSSFRGTGGRLAEGLEYDVAFHRTMNDELLHAHPDPALRRVALFDRIADALIPHLDAPNVHVVRYERWFDEADQLLDEIADFLGTPSLRPGPVTIRRTAPPPDDDVRLVAEHCRTVEALGYERTALP